MLFCFFYRYLVDRGCIPPLCDLLTLTDVKTIQVALNGLDNILKAGQQSDQRDNPYAALIEECFGNYFLSFIHKECNIMECGKFYNDKV
jgi:importin subunit alpha-6/7